MSPKAILAIFFIVFSLGILAVVVLPFLAGQGPASPRPAAPEEPSPEIPAEGFFRSDDGGTTWQSRSWIEGQGGSIASFRVNQLLRDPRDSETLYLATDGNGLWVTHSRGDLWAQVVDESAILDPRANVLAVAINPDRPAEWYVAVFQKNRGRVLKTADGGKTWREIYFTPLERFGVFDLHYDRGRGAVIIATGQGDLLETTNQGRTWRRVRLFADGLVRVLVNPLSPAVRFVATSRGSLFRTEDGGSTWSDLTPAFESFSGSKKNQRWVIDQSGTLYLGSDHGVLRSRDNGTTFVEPPLIIPPETLPVLAMAVDPRDRRHLVVSASNQLYATRDDGVSWGILPSPGVQKVTHLAFDWDEPQVRYSIVRP